MPRRSISQSLTAREIEFIRAPLVETKTKDSSPKVSESKKTPKKPKPVSAPTSPAATSATSQKTSKPADAHEPWITITTRLPSSLHSRLRRTAFERTERNEEPSTIQDILAAGASAWLEKNEPSE